MGRLCIFISLFFFSIGSLWASQDYATDYGYYDSYYPNIYINPTNVFTGQTSLDLSFNPGVNNYNSSASFFPAQKTTDAFNNANALGNTIKQAMPPVEATKEVVQSQPNFSPVDQKEFNLYLLDQQEAYQDYSRKIMEENNRAIQNTLENNTVPEYPVFSTAQVEPIYILPLEEQ